MKTPFFGELVDYAEEGNMLWTCPGHNGGVFYSRSPIGRIFVEHLGEAIFRDDLDNSVLELGDLLTHEGPALRAQKEAAKIFGAERTYFVLNGTSASNKIVLSALVAPDDLVLFDRNNHKAAHHGALMLGGGVPIYLETDRNAFGLIGPIDYEALDEKAIREKIRNNPLVTDKDAWKRERPFRVAVIEQCSYDGTIYNAETDPGKDRPPLRLHPVRRGLGRLHEVPSDFRRPFRHGPAKPRAERAGHHRHAIDPQAARELFAGLANPFQGPPHQGPEPPRRAQALQRDFSHPRLHLAVLSAVRLARRRRADDEGQVRRGAVGRHHPPRHRNPQENPGAGKRIRGKGQGQGQRLVLRSLRARRGRETPATAGCAWEDVPTDDLAENSAYWTFEPGAGWHGFSMSRKITRSPTPASSR